MNGFFIYILLNTQLKFENLPPGIFFNHPPPCLFIFRKMFLKVPSCPNSSVLFSFPKTFHPGQSDNAWNLKNVWMKYIRKFLFMCDTWITKIGSLNMRIPWFSSDFIWECCWFYNYFPNFTRKFSWTFFWSFKNFADLNYVKIFMPHITTWLMDLPSKMSIAIWNTDQNFFSKFGAKYKRTLLFMTKSHFTCCPSNIF